MNAGSKCLTLLPLSSISFILNRDIQIPLAHDHYWVSCTIMDAATAVERALCMKSLEENHILLTVVDQVFDPI